MKELEKMLKEYEELIQMEKYAEIEKNRKKKEIINYLLNKKGNIN